MVKLSHLWKMNMSKPSLAQGSLFTMEELNGCLYENIQDFSGSAKLRLFLSPYLKKMFCRVELPVLWVFANAICKYFYHKKEHGLCSLLPVSSGSTLHCSFGLWPWWPSLPPDLSVASSESSGSSTDC